MIVKTINEDEFVTMFNDYNRADNFSPKARRELFAYYEELSEGMGEPFEMDVVGICVDWGEYTGQELIDEYGDPDYDPPGDFDTCLEILLDRLHDETTVIEVEHYNGLSTYLVQAF